MVQSEAIDRASGGRPPGVAILNPLAAEIARALLDLGGAAHRDVVVDLVAKKRGFYRPPEALRREIDAVFSVYGGDTPPSSTPVLLHRPFGPFSQRWALTPQGRRLLSGAGLDL